MLRKRERFERTDVPQNKKAGFMLAAVAGAFVLVGLLIGMRWSWVMAHRDTNLADRALKSGLSAQSDVAVPDGFVLSQDEVSNVVVFTVDNPHAKQPQLQRVEILSLNATKSTGTLMNIPVETKINLETGDTTLAAQFAGAGASECIVPLSKAANVHISHAVVATESIWDDIALIKRGGMQGLIGRSTKVLESLKSDMSFGEMADLAEGMLKVGKDNLSRKDAPASDDKLEDGTQVKNLDAHQLTLDLGLLQPAS